MAFPPAFLGWNLGMLSGPQGEKEREINLEEASTWWKLGHEMR